MTVLRSRADKAYVLGVARGGCKNGGWVQMWEQTGQHNKLFHWVIHKGVLRASADLRYVLCITQDACRNGGWVHMWEQDDDVDIYGHWIIDGNYIRAMADPGYVLCVRQDGCTQGGYLHLWSYEEAPDVYAEWEFENGSLALLSPQPKRTWLSIECSREIVEEIGKITDLDPGWLAYAARVGTTPFRPAGEGPLGPIVYHFKTALQFGECAATLLPQGRRMCVAGTAVDLRREPFMEGLEALVLLLDGLCWRLGTLMFRSDLQKLYRSRACPQESGYREWLVSEISVHAANGYAEYVNDSAAMANLWIARTLDFFARLFALLCDGKGTAASVEGAYAQTLHEHHGFLQRRAFLAAVGQLPDRQELLLLLQGDLSRSWKALLQEAAAFAEYGRHAARLCLRIDKGLAALLESNRSLMQTDWSD